MRHRPDPLTAAAFCCLVVLAGYALLTNPPLALFVLGPLAVLPRAARAGRLAAAATRDGKTKLLTAEEWAARAAHGLRRSGGGGAVFMIDIDGFKPVNDTRGHLAGDAVLRVVAQVLTAALRVDDLAGRFGGDEFVVALAGVSPAHAMRVAERVRARVAATAECTVSIGVACRPEDGSTVEELLAEADAACYAAKSVGGDCCVGAGQRTRKPGGSPSGADHECATLPTQPGA